MKVNKKAVSITLPICNDDYICVDNVDGEEEHIPWTLQTYIKLSSIIDMHLKHSFTV